MKRLNVLILLSLFYVSGVVADESYKSQYHVANHEDLYAYVVFGFDNNQLTTEDKNNLKKVIEYIQACDDYRLVLIGHTDDIGTTDYNVNLASERVDVVLGYLSHLQEIPQDKIIVKNRNEFDPAATNETEQGRWRNRRVDIYVQKL